MESMEFLNLVTLKHDVWQELTDLSLQLEGRIGMPSHAEKQRERTVWSIRTEH